MRYLFTDGTNSAWQCIFGFFAVLFWWISPLYVAYQLWHPYDKNIFVDFSEFIIGYVVGYLTGAPIKAYTATKALIDNHKK